MRAISILSAVLSLLGAALVFAGPTSFPLWTAGALLIVALAFLFAPNTFRTAAVRVLTPAVVAVLMILLYDLLGQTELHEHLQTAFSAPDTQLDLFVEIFSGTVSGLYALIIAFMVFKSLQDHDNINFTLRDEAMLLDSMSQILPYLHDDVRRSNIPVVTAAHAGLRSYAENILSEGFKTGAQQAENQRIIDEFFERIRNIAIEDENDKITVDLLMSRIDKLATVRTRRIAYMMERPSPFMILMLIVLSVLTVGPFYLPVIGGVALSKAIIAVLGFCIAFLFVMMLDMSSHFEGYWSADRGPFETTRERITKRLEELKTQAGGRAAG